MGIIMKNGVCYSNGGNTTIQPVIYSDTEREVGVWRDGKPLYQKTFTADMTGQQSVVIPFSDSNIFVIKFECIAHQEGSDGIISIEPKTSGSLFTVETVEGYGIYTRTGLRITRPSTSSYEPPTVYCTVWYIKTTDTAGSGIWTPSGVPAVHYSTDEQIVGTWIDGKTLYQKTYYYTHNDTISSGYITIGTISGYEYLQFVNCMYYNSTDGRYYSIPYTNGSATTVPYLENGNIQLRVSSDTWGPEWGVVITVQYTKASS